MNKNLFHHIFLTTANNIIAVEQSETAHYSQHCIVGDKYQAFKIIIWNVLFLHFGKIYPSFSFKYLSMSTYFYQMNRMPKDCSHEYLNLRSKVQCFRSFLLNYALFTCSLAGCTPILFQICWWVRLTVNRLFLPLRSGQHTFAFKKTCIKENFPEYCRYIVTKRLFNLFFTL